MRENRASCCPLEMAKRHIHTQTTVPLSAAPQHRGVALFLRVRCPDGGPAPMSTAPGWLYRAISPWTHPHSEPSWGLVFGGVPGGGPGGGPGEGAFFDTIVV